MLNKWSSSKKFWFSIPRFSCSFQRSQKNLGGEGKFGQRKCGRRLMIDARARNYRPCVFPPYIWRLSTHSLCRIWSSHERKYSLHSMPAANGASLQRSFLFIILLNIAVLSSEKISACEEQSQNQKAFLGNSASGGNSSFSLAFIIRSRVIYDHVSHSHRSECFSLPS